MTACGALSASALAASAALLASPFIAAATCSFSWRDASAASTSALASWPPGLSRCAIAICVTPSVVRCWTSASASRAVEARTKYAEPLTFSRAESATAKPPTIGAPLLASSGAVAAVVPEPTQPKNASTFCSVSRRSTLATALSGFSSSSSEVIRIARPATPPWLLASLKASIAPPSRDLTGTPSGPLSTPVWPSAISASVTPVSARAALPANATAPAAMKSRLFMSFLGVRVGVGVSKAGASPRIAG